MDVQTALSGVLSDDVLEVPFRGKLLLERPLLNKGSAFTEEERRELGLLGLLPPRVETLEEQTLRAYEAYLQKPDDIERHIYLRQLQDHNETLFYRLLLNHLAELMPIIYTPTVGLACQRFSHILRRVRGLYIAYPNRDVIDAILENAASPHVEVIVVTDGERILGLGDQGAGGMGIPIGKLSLYTACGGIHPATTLPILLDVGTNNEERLHDPLYIGWRHERISGQEYDDFIEAFVQAVNRKFPKVLLQWEDFAQGNASRLLARYRDRLCTFNDDIQGTAAVTLGTILAAVGAADSKVRDQRIVVLGAGSAGCGIAEQLVAAMVEEGLPKADALSRVYMLNRQGLLHDKMTDLKDFQRPLAQSFQRIASWPRGADGKIEFLDVIKNARPTILIGVSGQPGAFNEEAIRAMAEHVERPIILPLSNPTSRSEATPSDLYAWTGGKALIATGSPYNDLVLDNGRHLPIAQCNNSYIFPAMGLGVLASGARRVSDAMFMAAAHALAECAPARTKPDGALLPPLAQTRKVARVIAAAVAKVAQKEGLASPCSAEQLDARISAKMWEPHYQQVKFKTATT
jgi:malate dehydrogenase (oxaloacetate-decarboxylating)